ncbi:hypothetical protein PYCC9005_000143 [Savitreella phatthalungensis]
MSKVVDTAPTDSPELQGFKYVSRKKVSRRQAQRDARTAKDPLAQLHVRYNTQRALLLEHKYVDRVIELLDTAHIDRVGLHFRLLGIGILANAPSVTQLAFAVLLGEALGLPMSEVRASDPMFREVDRDFLTSLGVQVVTIAEGEVFDTHHNTLLFLPHVPKSVTERALRTFWDKDILHRLTIIGNDIRRYPDTYPHTRLQKESPCLLAAAAWADVHPLPNDLPANNVFNDLAVHRFATADPLPQIDFDAHKIEQEHFETNADDA